jgi:hypothetical protein
LERTFGRLLAGSFRLGASAVRRPDLSGQERTVAATDEIGNTPVAPTALLAEQFGADRLHGAYARSSTGRLVIQQV